MRKLLAGCLIGLTAFAVNLAASPPASAAATSYTYPCNPYRLSGYNFGQYVSGAGYHAGQDVCGAAGTPVYAVAEGTVMYSARTPDSYRWGNLIMIQHVNPDGSQVTSLYGHLSADRRVAAGQTVAKGQLIGFVGPGWTSENGNWGAHVHAQLRAGAYGAGVGAYPPNMSGYVGADRIGQFLNPANYIAARQSPAPAPPAPAPNAVYDYQVAGINVIGDQSGKNAEYYYDFYVRNTGNVAWHPANVKLGTDGPRDRASGFSSGMIGQGWSGANRIDLLGSVAPGQTGIFRARFSNKAVPPGVYVERFTPVVEGVGWMAHRGFAATIPVNPPRTSAAWYSQGAYSTISSNDANPANLTSTTYLAPGKKVNLKAYLTNNGEVPWSVGGANPVRLGLVRPADRASGFYNQDGSIPASERWINPNRPSGIDGRYDPNSKQIVPATTINPGEIAVFSWTATVPNIPGDHYEYVNPVVEGVGWMNDLQMWYRMRILPGGYHFEYAGQQNPDPVALGKGADEASVDLRNSGQKPWAVGGNVRLGTDRQRDRASSFHSQDWVNPSRLSGIDANVTSPGKQTIDPGEVGRFTFNVSTSTAKDGTYPEYVQPVAEGETWFPEPVGVYFPAVVRSPSHDYQVVQQRFDRSTNVRYGDEVMASLVVRNLGSAPWPVAGANPVRLGTTTPNDRISGFFTGSGTDPWLSPTRASGIDGLVTNLNPLSTAPVTEVKQGELALFRTRLKAPAVQPGVYNDFLNLVHEGVGWFPDYRIYYPLNILGP